MTDRIHIVSYTDINSIQRYTIFGVTQGIVLGPLLFIIYTNDLPNALLYLKCIPFAEDVAVYHTSNDLQMLSESVEHHLISLSDWFSVNKLSFVPMH